MAALDPRLLRVGIEVRGQIRTYENVAITAVGNKFANPNQGECNITLANLRRDVVDFILSETSPFNRNRTPKRVLVEAGRRSTGLSLVYAGNIFRSSITQPPDAVLSLRALTGQFAKGAIVSRETSAIVPLSRIAAGVAEDIGLPLVFEATDRQVANYAFTGAATKQVDKLADLAPIDVFIDRDQLVVKDRDVPLTGKTRVLDADSGMIGVPTLTEQGAQITFLWDSQTVLGGRLAVTSRQYPALNGQYVIYRLSYTLSNRDTPFYYVADCRRLQ